MGSRTRLAVTSCAQWSVIKEQRWVCKGWCANTSCGYDCLLSNNPRNLGSFLRPALAAKLPHDAAVAISSRQSPTATATAATSRHAGACVDRESSSALRQQSSGVAAVSTNLTCPAQWGGDEHRQGEGWTGPCAEQEYKNGARKLPWRYPKIVNKL